MEEFIKIGGLVSVDVMNSCLKRKPNEDILGKDKEGNEIVVKEKLSPFEYMNSFIVSYLRRIHTVEIARAKRLARTKVTQEGDERLFKAIEE